MATNSQSPVRENPLGLLDGAAYVLGAALTLLTVGYATVLAFGLPRVGIYAQSELYVNVFLGVGLAAYYVEYARSQLRDAADRSELRDGAADSDGRGEGAATGRSSGVRGRFRAGFARIDPAIAIVLAAIALLSTAYVHVHFGRLFEDAHLAGYTTVDILVGTVLIALAIDATRRAFGWIIAAVAVASVLYAHWLVIGIVFLTSNAIPVIDVPDVFRHTGMSWADIARDGAIGINGVYDPTLMGIGSTWVAIFIMFAGIAKAFGLMDFILTVGRELGTSLRTGVVQVAVVSSMIMGSITGSAAANTATTGSFTIPMLKEQGVRDDFAASIEAVASAGGQILPPVMGVAAFLMADILGVSYVQVIQAGVVPAALFYLSVCVAVHFTVLKFGWTSSDLSSFDWRLLLGGVHFTIPLFVLLYTLIYLRYTPLSAGLYTILSIVGVMIVKNLYDDGVDLETARATSRQTLDGVSQGGLEMAPLVGVLAAMGLIVELLEGTGLTQGVATAIIGLGSGMLVVVLALAMVASIMFGLGMPTPAAYILVVVLVAPGVVRMGVPELTTHMFVFYFAMLSAITPPVAISVAIGSRIAGTSFTKSCLQALRIGAPGFVIPFTFVANNSLIYWSRETLFAFPVVLFGTIGLIVATVGFDGAHDLDVPRRALYAVAAIAAMFGSIEHVGIQVAGAAVIAAGLVYANVIVGYGADSRRGVEPSTLE
ncbi:TRAP transporter permease [Natronococcus wangiae]|uniref:TRAP transporter permease n=1 Tax=Natronococcus wangiae TaxID=3068275 RepID=UPI00273D14AD|nr:TRAP transporter fused permease subunit [Natronococcus sp. AD5]